MIKLEWGLLFYAVVIVAMLWLLFTFCWLGIKKCRRPATVPEVSESSSIICECSPRVPAEEQPLPSYKTSAVYRDSLRYRNSSDDNSNSDDANSDSRDDTGISISDGYYYSRYDMGVQFYSSESSSGDCSSRSCCRRDEKSVEVEDDSNFKSITGESSGEKSSIGKSSGSKPSSPDKKSDTYSSRDDSGFKSHSLDDTCVTKL